jgi:hypothetical protein
MQLSPHRDEPAVPRCRRRRPAPSAALAPAAGILVLLGVPARTVVVDVVRAAHRVALLSRCLAASALLWQQRRLHVVAHGLGAFHGIPHVAPDLLGLLLPRLGTSRDRVTGVLFLLGPRPGKVVGRRFPGVHGRAPALLAAPVPGRCLLTGFMPRRGAPKTPRAKGPGAPTEGQAARRAARPCSRRRRPCRWPSVRRARSAARHPAVVTEDRTGPVGPCAGRPGLSASGA